MSKVKVDMENPETDHTLLKRLTAALGVTPKETEYDEQGYLIKLNLSWSNITQLPKELGQLTHLQELDLSRNQLTHIPPDLGPLPKLQFLFLYDNQLTHIPPELGQLPKLQALSLHNNQLTHIPPELGQLPNLLLLFLHHNQLTHIPPELGQLANLQGLYLHHNQLTHISPEFGQLTNLQYLYLHHNQLTHIPPEFGQLANLQYLYLDNNPGLLTPPPEIVTQGTQAVLSFLRELHRLRYEAKLILIGEGGTGKSSLLRAFGGKGLDASLETTHGIEVGTLPLPHPSLPGQSLQLNTWDFGGQDIYRATHQFFLTKRSLYLVVWNARLGAEQGRLDY